MNPIKFLCSTKEILSMYIDDKDPILHALVKWSCSGYISGIDKQPDIQILGNISIYL